ncbi:hypothetical protein DENSPDRAFT_838165 [Dentipellis sp. KUC8613]|nr:hypothetical protein DENSPDRAFT_838165 [Dentipellis sp. KUC8613]
MCLGNRAEVSSMYVNGQLRTLWENSQHCIRKHAVKEEKPASPELEYGFALGRFYLGTQNRSNPDFDNLSFYGSFECPRIEFACNHEVILYLQFSGGHYHLDTNKTTPRSKTETKILLAGCQVAFRINFLNRGVSGVACPEIGNANAYDLDFIVLDIESASFCDDLFKPSTAISKYSSPSSKDQDNVALKYYLRRYLDLLKRTGNHVFYTLPDFDDLSREIIIDYSADSNAAPVDIEGITASQMNHYLSSLWSQALSIADSTASAVSVDEAVYLFEHRGTWKDQTGEVEFHALFNAPEVRPLCRHEVALSFNIREVVFKTAGLNVPEFPGWKITFIVQTDLQHAVYGKKLRVEISTAHFSEQLSVFAGNHVLYDRLRDALINYLSTKYLAIFEAVHHSFIFDSDFVFVPPTPEVEQVTDIGCWCPSGCTHSDANGHVYWGPAIEKMVTYSDALPYDFATSVTQGSINNQLSILWTSASQQISVARNRLSSVHALAEYAFTFKGRVLFSATFNAPEVQLICTPGSKKAVVHFHVREATLRSLGVGSAYDVSAKEHHLSDYMVAFEVDLQLRTCSKGDEVPSLLHDSPVYADYREYQQLVLDYSTARLSKVTASRSTNTADILSEFEFRQEKRDALVHYLKNEYLRALVLNGSDVLYTLPVTPAKSDPLHLTSLTFEVLPIPYSDSQRYRDGLHGRYDRNAVVFVGMVEGRPLPFPLTSSAYWICAGFSPDMPSGTVVLSRRALLEGKLLPLLSTINSKTRLVPSFSTVEGDRWILDLSTWAEHPHLKTIDCPFKLTTHTLSNALEFNWDKWERWSYAHGQGHSGVDEGSYTVTTDTSNKLLIPTGLVGESCDLELSGSVALKLESTVGVKAEHWQSEAVAKWTVPIHLSSNGESGISVHVSSDDIIPDVVSQPGSRLSANHPSFVDALAELKKHVSTIKIDALITELRTTLEGVWQHLYTGSARNESALGAKGTLCARMPVFTKGGDLILELLPYSPGATGRLQTTTTSASVASKVQNGNGRASNGTTNGSRTVSIELNTSATWSPETSYSPLPSAIPSGVIDAVNTLGNVITYPSATPVTKTKNKTGGETNILAASKIEPHRVGRGGYAARGNGRGYVL